MRTRSPQRTGTRDEDRESGEDPHLPQNDT